MSHLSKLNLSTKSPRHKLSPVDRKKQKLLAQLDKQIEAANAELNDIAFVEEVKRWVRVEGSDDKQLVTKTVPFRHWWWKNEIGQVMFSLRVNNRVLEIEPGKPAIEIGRIDHLPVVLATLREAIVAGELDERLKLETTRLNDLEKPGKKSGKPT